jgi:subtilisin family serine protease
MTMAADRAEEVKAWKHAILNRYLESGLLGTYEPSDERNVFYVRDQVVVPTAKYSALSDRLESYAARGRRPRFGLHAQEGLQAFAGLASRIEVDETVIVDLDPGKKIDTVEFAAGHQDDGVTLNHLVTGLQRRTGYPDGDPELPVHPLPALSSQRSDVGNGVTVAVIDTGYPTEQAVSDELERSWFGYDCDFSTKPGEVDDEGRPLRHIDLVDGPDRDSFLDAEAGHGLFIGGLVRQIAPRAKLLFLKALNSDGMGTELGVARAIGYAVSRGAQVINLSLGFYTLKDTNPSGVAGAVKKAHDAGCAVVAAAGNDDIDDPTYPAALPEVIGVGALDKDNAGKASFSNDGDWVNVFAPGQHVQSTYVIGREDRRYTRDRNADEFTDTAVWSGTSFACGIVSGHIAANLVAGQDTPAKQAEDIVGALPEFGTTARKLIPQYAFG